MYLTDTDVMQQCRFFNKNLVITRYRQAVSNLQGKTGNVPAVFKNNFERFTLKITSQ
jgi:hypothetical protein